MLYLEDISACLPFSSETLPIQFSLDMPTQGCNIAYYRSQCLLARLHLYVAIFNPYTNILV